MNIHTYRLWFLGHKRNSQFAICFQQIDTETPIDLEEEAVDVYKRQAMKTALNMHLFKTFGLFSYNVEDKLAALILTSE